MTPQIMTVLVDQIDPHPSNPRRDLGDLTELAGSIRAHGIRQNLLLVPHCSGCPDVDQSGLRVKDDGTSWCTIHKKPGRLRTVIGHRRLAAARMAGVVEVPAVVDAKLTDADQVELMLLENIQRADLSPIEEAEGYQQLLDLGVQHTMIAKRTGRAVKTIRGRLALLGLADEAREKIHTRQATLEDAAELLAFGDDPDELAILSDALGTNDFAWKVQHARERRQRAVAQQKMIDRLIAKGLTRVFEVSDAYKHVEYVYDKLPKDLPAGGVFTAHYAGFTIYRPKTQEELDQTDKSAAAEERREAREAAKGQAKAELDTERVTVWQLREDFVRGLVARTKQPTPVQRQKILTTLLPQAVTGGSSWGLGEWLGVKSLGDELRAKLTELCVETAPEWLLIAWAHTDIGEMKYTYPAAMARPNTVAVYSVLEALGYTISEVERSRLQPPGSES